ncbi:Uncharacterised protein [Amycolatopsis camponoti]|uniref:Uncharacterized protein n=1 Tax=Amycolatopsis camponoti TaxID=2606593 RepID=A0A6I8LR96_9PSEU|nr:Uncharacterised protein [Amycolatopsis camponoti]
MRAGGSAAPGRRRGRRAAGAAAPERSAAAAQRSGPVRYEPTDRFWLAVLSSLLRDYRHAA